jgi:hypothetical protein
MPSQGSNHAGTLDNPCHSIEVLVPPVGHPKDIALKDGGGLMIGIRRLRLRGKAARCIAVVTCSR